MIPLLTAGQMQECDRIAIEKYRIPGLVLMENAGRAVVEEMERMTGTLRGKRVLICCGKGNNGGDGFVIARHLANRGVFADVLLLGKRTDVRGDARVNLEVLLRMARGNDTAVKITEIRNAGTLRRVARPDAIVDAVFGTGFDGTPSGMYRAAIQWMNAQDVLVVAVDIPSGVVASTGAVLGGAVRAQLTVTMGAAKIGHFVGLGPDYCGTVRIADISIPRAVLATRGKAAMRVEEADIRRLLPARPRTAHKYSVGKVLVVAGSRHYTGAAHLAAHAALRAGAGAVLLAVPMGIRPIMARKTTEVIVLPAVETPEGTFAASSLDMLLEKSEWADAVVLGPGMSRNPETDELILRLIQNVGRPMILDADGLTALASRTAVARKRGAPMVLTPHTGELARLVRSDAALLESHRIDAARDAARSLKSVLVLKGAPTVTARTDGTAVVNSTGNPGMATIGAGDVLAGLIGGLLAQGMDAFDAGFTAVFLHGRAGDLAAVRYGKRSILATDILDHIAPAFLPVDI
jgi:ADP-dependent NAD(P)H-hydrate dehydratase / NAD(P)H-hydrate epimerase